MTIFYITLILATLLCSLVAGFLFAFAIVVMPGIRTLNDREFLQAFQVMDGVIQKNQPLFVLVWAGSALALVTAAVLGYGQIDWTGRLHLILTTIAYIIGVQLPTIMINIPLNNKIQSLDIDALSEVAQKTTRNEFEPRWNKWNISRTIVASLTSVLLLLLLLKL